MMKEHCSGYPARICGPLAWMGNGSQVIVSDIGIAGGLAFDPDDGHIYWSRSNLGVERANTDGTGREVVLPDNSFPTSEIFYDTIVDKLFWYDSFARSMKRSDVDGSNEEVLIEQQFFDDLSWGLTGDTQSGRIIWSVPNLQEIASLNRNGIDNGIAIGSKRTVQDGLSGNTAGLAIGPGLNIETVEFYDCFDLESGQILPGPDPLDCPIEADFRLAYGSLFTPSSVVFQNEKQGVEIAHVQDPYSEVDFDDVNDLNLTSDLISEPFDSTVVLRTAGGNYYKLQLIHEDAFGGVGGLLNGHGLVKMTVKHGVIAATVILFGIALLVLRGPAVYSPLVQAQDGEPGFTLHPGVDQLDVGLSTVLSVELASESFTSSPVDTLQITIEFDPGVVSLNDGFCVGDLDGMQSTAVAQV